jgi:hypothetical protein
MKRILMLSSIALVCASVAFAQGTSTQTSDQSSGTGMSSSAVQGCLSGADGNYMLTEDGTGTMYKLTGKSSKLKDHVGHEVAVTGQMSGGGSAASQPDQGQSAATGSGDGSSATHEVQVSEVKMISKHCASGTSPSQPQ